MRTLVFIAAVLVVGGGCGSKSGLALLAAGGNAGSASGGASATGGTSATGGGSSGGSGGTAGFGGSGGVLTAPDCRYEIASPHLETFQWSDGVRSPLLATLKAGAQGGLAEFAVAATHGHFWHPDIRVAKMTMGPTGTGTLSVDKFMTVYGVDSHATGHLIHAGTGLNLLYYHGDEANPSVVPGVKFRRFNINSWNALPEVTIEDQAGFAYDIVDGPGVDSSGSYTGPGRFIAWRGATIAESVVETRVGLADQNGKLLRGPVVAAGPANFNQFGAAVAWTGTDYLVATNEFICLDDQLCSNGITVSQFQPGSGSSAALSQAAAFPANPALRARTPQLQGLGGRAFAVWREVDTEPGTPQTLRVNVVDGVGNVIGPESTYQIQATAGPVLHTSDQGAVVLYSELGDSDGPSDAFGHSVIMLQQHAKTGAPLQTLSLQTTSLTSGTPYAAAALDSPRGLMIAWTGTSAQGTPNAALYFTFLKCQPVN